MNATILEAYQNDNENQRKTKFEVEKKTKKITRKMENEQEIAFFVTLLIVHEY